MFPSDQFHVPSTPARISPDHATVRYPTPASTPVRRRRARGRRTRS